MLLLTLALSLISSAAAAQRSSYAVETLGTGAGLSQSIVYDIVQDSRGYLWFATRDGINRYDGYDFTVVRHVPGNNHSLPQVSADIIAEGPHGKLWVKSGPGITLFDRDLRRDTVYRHNPNDTTGISSDGVQCFAKDSSGVMWIGTDQGLDRYNPTTRRFERVEPEGIDTFDNSASITSLYCARSGDLWVGTLTGRVWRLERNGGQWRRYDLDSQAVVFAGEDSLGVIYSGGFRESLVASMLRLCAIDPRTDAITRPLERLYERHTDAGDILSVPLVDVDGDIWLYVQNTGEHGPEARLLHTTWDKLVAWRPGATDAFEQFDLHARMYSFRRDRSGIIWVGTSHGIVKIAPSGKRFDTFRIPSPAQAGAKRQAVRAILAEGPDLVWVGAADNLYRLDRRLGVWTGLYGPNRTAGGSAADAVNVLYRDKDGALLIGVNQGLLRYNDATGAFEKIKLTQRNNADPTVYSIWSILRDSTRRLWLGTRAHGVLVYDSTGALLRHYRTDSSAAGLTGGVVWDILQDRQGDVWVGTAEGVCRFDPVEQSLRRYPFDAAFEDADALNACDIMETRAGKIWIAAYGGGLLHYDRERDVFHTVPGLPEHSVYMALEDLNGDLWLSSNNGLIRYTPATNEFRTYNAGDGLQDNEFTFRAAYGASDGELFFGGVNGLNAFYPAELRDNPNAPPLAITNMRVFDRIIRSDIGDGESVTLDHDQDFFAFEFAALDYTNPSQNQYAYKLEGFDRGWIYCGKRRYAGFTNLDPGEYVFRLRASNNDGVWNERGISIFLHIMPPIWQTAWFIWLACITGAGLLATIVYIRLRALRRRAELHRQMVELRLQALRLQMDPHFIFNSLNAIQNLMLKNETHSAADYLSHFATLVRMVLDSSTTADTPIGKEQHMLQLYLELESLRFQHAFAYSIDIDPAINRETMRIPAMLIQPHVENAIRHGNIHKRPSGRVDVRFELCGDDIFCTVEDNGFGRPTGDTAPVKSGRQPIGIAATRQRLDILNAASGKESIALRIIDLHDEDGAPAGAKVELRIPLRRAD